MQAPEDPEQACKKLVDKTLAGGAPDNVTVIVIHYCDDETSGNGSSKIVKKKTSSNKTVK
jgi:serine/threonine protein phosphatase PrpC